MQTTYASSYNPVSYAKYYYATLLAILSFSILYMSNSKTPLWLVFTLFSLFLLAEHFVQFGMPIGKLA